MQTPGTGLVYLPDDVQALMVGLLERERLELPLLPAVAAEVVALCNSADADAADLREVVYRNPALTAHILRIANSVVFRTRVPIDSLQQAIARMGFEQVAEIALAAAAQTKVFDSREHQALTREMWRHSVAAACCAKEIARLVGGDQEAAFLCGLLHDVGKPLILNLLVDAERGALKRRLAAWELHEAMDIYHPFVGALLADRWHLPEEVRFAVLHHHDYEGRTDDHASTVITALADHVAHLVVAEGLTPSVADIEPHPAVADLGIDREGLERLVEQLPAITQRVDAIG